MSSGLGSEKALVTAGVGGAPDIVNAFSSVLPISILEQNLGPKKERAKLDGGASKFALGVGGSGGGGGGGGGGVGGVWMGSFPASPGWTKPWLEAGGGGGGVGVGTVDASGFGPSGGMG